MANCTIVEMNPLAHSRELELRMPKILLLLIAFDLCLAERM